MKTIKSPNSKKSVNKILKTAKCLTIFGILAAHYNGTTQLKLNAVRAPSSLTLVTTSANLCAKIFHEDLGTSSKSHSVGRLIPTISQVPFGTGNGSLMTNSPRSVQLKNGQSVVAFVDRQRSKLEENAWLFITDARANQILHKLELDTEKIQTSTTMMTSRGPLFAFLGEIYVSPRKVTNLHIVDPQSGKQQLIELDGSLTGTNILFPKSPGESILVYEGNSRFATYDPLFGKKTEVWDLAGLKVEKYEDGFNIERIPGDSERIVLTSENQFVVINLNNRSIEWHGRNSFGRHVGIAQTSEGNILYGMGLRADAQHNRMTLRLFNLKTKEQYFIDMGDSNSHVSAITEVNINNRSYLAAAVHGSSNKSSLNLIDTLSGQPVWSLDLPTKAQTITLVPVEGQMPLLLVSPYLGDISKNGSTFVMPGTTYKIPDSTASNVVRFKPKQTQQKQDTETSQTKSDKSDSETAEEPRNGISWGYLISTAGERVATLEYEGGLRSKPYFYQQGRSLIIKYQSSYISALGTLVIPLKDK